MVRKLLKSHSEKNSFRSPRSPHSGGGGTISHYPASTSEIQKGPSVKEHQEWLKAHGYEYLEFCFCPVIGQLIERIVQLEECKASLREENETP